MCLMISIQIAMIVRLLMNSCKVLQELSHYVIHDAVRIKLACDRPVECIAQSVSCIFAAVLLLCDRLVILRLTDRLCDFHVENVDSLDLVVHFYILRSRQIVAGLAVEGVILRLIEPFQKLLRLVLHT